LPIDDLIASLERCAPLPECSLCQSLAQCSPQLSALRAEPATAPKVDRKRSTLLLQPADIRVSRTHALGMQAPIGLGRVQDRNLSQGSQPQPNLGVTAVW